MKQLLTILMLVWAIPALAQLGSQTGAYGSVGVTAGQIAANGGLTNGTAQPYFATNKITAALSPLTVSGCTTFPFLNNTNWQLWTGPGATNGVYVEMPGGTNVGIGLATNYLYFDNIHNSFYEIATTLASPDGSVGVIESDFGPSSSGSIDAIIGLDNGGWSPDAGLTISYGATNSLIMTNLAINSGNLIQQSISYSGGAGTIPIPMVSIQNTRGQNLVTLSQDNISGASADSGRVEMWGYGVGNPGIIHNVLRLHGFDLNIQNSLDQRAAAIWGKAPTQTGTNGGLLYLVTRSDFSAGNNTFNYGGYLDQYGNWSFGHNNPLIDSGVVQTNPAEITIIGSTKANMPQLLLESSVAYTGTATNGAIQSDGTNVYLTERGVTMPIAQQPTIIQTNWVDGKFYTNTYGTGITVTGPVKWTTAGVAGDVCEALWIVAAPGNGGSTNYVAEQTLVTSLAQTITNSPCTGFIPTNAAFCWTNLSAGAGDAAAVLPGQIKYP